MLTKNDIIEAAKIKYPKLGESLSKNEINDDDIVQAMLTKHPNLKNEYSTQETTMPLPEQPKQPSDLISKIKSIPGKAEEALSQFSYGAQKTMGMSNFGEPFPQPKGALGDIANVVGQGAGYFTGLPEARLAEKSIAPAITEGVRLLSKTKPVEIVSKGMSKITKPLKAGSKEALTYFGSILSSVPEEDLARIATKESSGKSILKGQFEPVKEFRKIGIKAQKALNNITKATSIAVKREVNALSEIRNPIDVTDVLENINNQKIARQAGRENMLTPKDKELVSDIENRILNLITDPNDPNAYANELHAIKTHIGDMLSWSKEAIQKPSSRGEQILKDVRNQINQKLRQASKKYAKANDESSKYQDLRDKLIPKLKDANLPQRMSGIIHSGDEYFKEMLQEIDNASPKSLKFYDQLLDAKARNAVRSVFTGRAGGSGSAEGMANLSRVELLKVLGQLGRGVASIGLYPIMSPKGQSQTIQAAVATPKIIKKTLLSKPVTTSAIRAPFKRNEQGQY